MRKKGSYYEAVDASDCNIAHPDFGRILAFTRDFFAAKGTEFFHRRKLTGNLRHLIIRRGIATDEILVNLVTAGEGDYTEYAHALTQIALDGYIVGVLNTVNNSLADAVSAEEVKILIGTDFYHEKFSEAAGGQRFKVSAFSFFQTNSDMAGDALYATVSEFAGDLTDKTVFDLYCGTGTIGIYLASRAARVVGIELVPAAIAAAQENAALNGITNCQFIAGDVTKIVKEQSFETRPDVIVLDPPREGVSPKAMPHIIAFDADKIVYVSCKPSSLLNDLPPLFAAGYHVEKIRCVDMFPRTANIEVVIELTARKGESSI